MFWYTIGPSQFEELLQAIGGYPSGQIVLYELQFVHTAYLKFFGCLKIVVQMCLERSSLMKNAEIMDFRHDGTHRYGFSMRLNLKN